MQFGSPNSTTCERVAPTDEMRPTRPSAVSTGRFSTMPSWAAEVDLNTAPPVCRVAQNNVGELEFPRRLPLLCKRRTKLVVFARDGPGLEGQNFQPVVFVAKIFNLLEQFTAREHGVGRSHGKLLRAVPARPSSGRNKLPMASASAGRWYVAAG